jgi:hypothetical protein
MKIRNGFVSNSSSSSFVVIDTSELLKHRLGRGQLCIPQTLGGELDFGRNNQNYNSLSDRINWAFMQAYSMDRFQANYGDIWKKNDYMAEDKFWEQHKLSDFSGLVEMVRETLRKYLYLCNSYNYKIKVCLKDENFDSDVEWERYWLNDDKVREDEIVFYSLDHGSAWFQNPRNLMIFENETMLLSFLFGVNSFVALRCDGVLTEDDKELDNNKELIITRENDEQTN